MKIDVMELLTPYYIDKDVTEVFAKACLLARIDTLGSDKFDDGYEPDYHRALEDRLENLTIPFEVVPSVLGEFLMDRLLYEVRGAL